ncbi:mitochondrial-processing peptidase subunit alpha [Neurospora tetrasperma FGSC 2508]|uniref:Mitochondrial-processing peptidase subunit alpha n=1 Tax=Neurospora tetrasperma (strain FGSC 2508 / ATCC MYA-4615 / P0657) TaxID=510951 RepID=F8MM07_NEUT8|nr:mitochondrial-processing peptidase subunit alpha [Neurospora tetrasperma FGSC 2508]EGO57681.1 mitochondrial-processing peptidase subunit alpha [Neurospora tetrasperma FGSC 2508]EGZ72050.1 mitochondrial processing peptidase alpha subunit [Neurospora tetrasperma FGSC 2509]
MLNRFRPARLVAQSSRCLPLTRARAGPLPVNNVRTLATRAAAVNTKEPTERDNITTLSNGVRVASEDLPDAFSGVGVYIDAGSRYENDYVRGASHIMDRLAFKSTSTRTADEMLETVEKLGGNIQCASSRESMMYQAATFNKAIPTAVELMAETIRDPKLTDEELEGQIMTAQYEVNEIWSKAELILPELVHMAAFKDNTLGNPLLCPKERLDYINRDVIQTYRDAFYRPERLVVAFAGVPHEKAVKLAEKYFGDMKASDAPGLSRTGSETSVDSLVSESSEASSASSSSSSDSSESSGGLLSKLFSPKAKKATPNPFLTRVPISTEDLTRPAHYTGGFLTLPPQPPPLNPNLPTFTHIQLAFEGLAISDDDIYALATLQTLLGGGGSFSAGGPGKGMYSRLYTNVLNQHGWVESCVAFNHSYTDSGLFGIAASCYPGRTLPMLQVMCRELHALTTDHGYSALGELEVSRAKNQLRSSLLMNLESRMVELEDLGRQVQVHGRKIPVREMTRRINELTVKDLRRVAKRVVGGMANNAGQGSGAPTVVLQEATVQGLKTTELGWDQIQDTIAQWKLGRR